MTRIERLEWYKEKLLAAASLSPDHYTECRRQLCQTDLFYLLAVVLQRKDVNRDWVYERCNEVRANPNGHLDLWAREHFKSTIITFGLTIQDILNDPEITIGIFSFNRPTAKAFMRQIMNEFRANEDLKALFPEILWANPEAQAPKWAEDGGLVVKRVGNPKEATVEAWGLVDGQPTSKHYRLMIYDDVVTQDSVTTPDMIRKVTQAWENSLNLTTEGGRIRYIGTRWAFNDTYQEILKREAAIPRIHPATVDGTEFGDPVLWDVELLRKKRREMGPYTFGCQLLQNPVADKSMGFKRDWLRTYADKNDGAGMNKYILVDPANEKKKESDYTAIGVIGLGPDENYYLLDGVRDRLNLKERGDALFSLHRRWRPTGVGYEKYGMQADIPYLEMRMGDENYRFDITELGGNVAKVDRIRRLVPIFEAGRFYLPDVLHKTDYEGRVVDLTQQFIEEEYVAFPVGLHEDFFDMLSRILDEKLGAIWPKPTETQDRYAKPKRKRAGRISYMAA